MKFLICLLLLSLASPILAEPFIVAHRGASGEAPENTLSAFDLAWKEGADAIEGDFHLTADGKIVCFHDRNTRKLTGKDLTIRNSTLAQLKALDAGSWKGRKFAGARIPTIEEVLKCVPAGKQIFVEIKCGIEIIPPLLEAIRKSGLSDKQIVIISFDKNVIRVIKNRRPDWRANWLFGFDSKKPGDPDKHLAELIATLEDIKADGLGSSSHPELSGRHLQTLKSKGFQHHVWTVNDSSIARHFFEMGSCSVTTDYPGALRESMRGELPNFLP